MKNNKTITVVIAVIIFSALATLGVWSYTRKKSSTQINQETNTKDQIAQTENSTTVKGNMFDLIKLGKSLKCTYSIDTSEIQMSGTSYVSGNRMRGDFETAGAMGEKVQSHIISDGTWMYSWTSASPTGIKMNIAKTQDKVQDTTSSKADRNISALTNPLDYECYTWSEDASLFTVPSDVKFTDFSETLKDLGTGGKNTLCSACQYSQNDEDKAACLKQFNCEQ